MPTSSATVYGNHTPKAEALADISRQHRGEDLVFFGDSRGDLEAARQTHVAFVGVINERDNFRGLDVVKLLDFASPEEVARAMREAIRMRSHGPLPQPPDANDK